MHPNRKGSAGYHKMKNENWQYKNLRVDSKDWAKTLPSLFFFLLILLTFAVDSKCYASILVQDSNQQSVSENTDALVPDAEVEKVITVEKRTEGTVTGIDRSGLAVEYSVSDETSKEIWLNFGAEISYRGLQDQSEIAVGDVVRAVYDESPTNARLVKEIVMIRKMPVEPEAPAEGEES